jgi:hypothetical protein
MRQKVARNEQLRYAGVGIAGVIPGMNAIAFAPPGRSRYVGDDVTSGMTLHVRPPVAFMAICNSQIKTFDERLMF